MELEEYLRLLLFSEQDSSRLRILLFLSEEEEDLSRLMLWVFLSELEEDQRLFLIRICEELDDLLKFSVGLFYFGDELTIDQPDESEESDEKSS